MLDSFTTLTGILSLSNITGLTDLDFLSGLTSIGNGVTLDSNPQLQNIDGLSNVTTLGGDIRIADNPLLTNIDGLANAEIINDDIVCDIDNNDGIFSVSSSAVSFEFISSYLSLLTDPIHSGKNLQRLSAALVQIRFD